MGSWRGGTWHRSARGASLASQHPHWSGPSSVIPGPIGRHTQTHHPLSTGAHQPSYSDTSPVIFGPISRQTPDTSPVTRSPSTVRSDTLTRHTPGPINRHCTRAWPVPLAARVQPSQVGAERARAMISDQPEDDGTGADIEAPPKPIADSRHSRQPLSRRHGFPIGGGLAGQHRLIHIQRRIPHRLQRVTVQHRRARPMAQSDPGLPHPSTTHRPAPMPARPRRPVWSASQ